MEKEYFLHLCVKKKCWSLLLALLDYGANINERNADGMTPLHIAAIYENKRELVLLLNRGAKVDPKDNLGNTPLHEGIRSIEIVKALLGKGASPHSRNIREETPLHLAVKERSVDVVKLLISVGVNVNAKDKDGNTPLHIGLTNSCREELLNILLESGSDVNAETSNGLTPLHIAAQSNNFTAVKLLLESGAAPNMIERFSIPTVGVIVNNEQGITALHYAAGNQNFAIAQLLLGIGADPNIEDTYGETPLHWIASRNCSDTTKCIIEMGADVNVKNAEGLTPLHFAVLHNRLEIVKLLLISGAVVNIASDEGVTPLHLSIQNRECDIMELLLQNGADVESKNIVGDTPLFIAIQNGSESHFEILLDCGANADIINNNGGTPLSINLKQKFIHIFRKHLLKRELITLLSNNVMDWTNLSSFQISCLEELKRMKMINYGTHSVFDILSKYNDPFFVTNSLLEQEVIDSKDKFPTYHFLLLTNFLRAKQRYRMLNEIQENFNNTIIPVEIMRKIFSYFSDEDLKYLVNAVEEEMLE